MSDQPTLCLVVPHIPFDRRSIREHISDGTLVPVEPVGTLTVQTDSQPASAGKIEPRYLPPGTYDLVRRDDE